MAKRAQKSDFFIEGTIKDGIWYWDSADCSPREIYVIGDRRREAMNPLCRFVRHSRFIWWILSPEKMSHGDHSGYVPLRIVKNEELITVLERAKFNRTTEIK